MNYKKPLFNIKHFIHRNSGKVSCGISILLVLFFNALGAIGFNSIMPYLVWLSVWAILWQLCDSVSLCPSPPQLIPALLISVVICFNLYIENFLTISLSATTLIRLVIVYSLIFF